MVVFHPLAQEQIRGIAEIQLDLLRRRLQERDLGLALDEAVVDKICEAGFDPVYGARPLKRTIQQLLENPLAQSVLSGEFAPGDTIRATLSGEQVAFERDQVAATA